MPNLHLINQNITCKKSNFWTYLQIQKRKTNEDTSSISSDETSDDSKQASKKQTLQAKVQNNHYIA